MIRVRDFLLSLIMLMALGPFLLVVSFLVWKQDRHSPFYIAERVGKNEKVFFMVKLRSMIINADSSGVDSTSSLDDRITPIGHLIRKYKLDELTQLWNVFKGDMGLVGPRPNVKRETSLYSKEEKTLLSIRPGITDFSSIVFSDEGEILSDYEDADLAYNQLIRPWKSRLGIIYINNRSFFSDLKLLLITAIAIVNRKIALEMVINMLNKIGCTPEIIRVASRKHKLYPHPPPGFEDIVRSRNETSI